MLEMWEAAATLESDSTMLSSSSTAVFWLSRVAMVVAAPGDQRRLHSISRRRRLVTEEVADDGGS